MENKDEKVSEEPVGRRTRSGKAVTPPAATPPKPTGKKTRKKVMLVEVEVSDDEDTCPGPIKSQEEKETDSDTIIYSTNIVTETKEDATEVDSDDIELATKIIDTHEKPLADKVAIITDEVVLLNEENETEDNVPVEDNLVTNGSEDKEICAIIENDVFEFDFEKEAKNVQPTETEDKIEETDVEMKEISESIETDACKLNTEVVEPPIESMDVDSEILTNDHKLESEVEIETDKKIVEGDKNEEEGKSKKAVITEEVEAMEVKEDIVESKEEVESKEVVASKEEVIESKVVDIESKVVEVESKDVMATKEAKDVMETKEAKEVMDTKEEAMEAKEEVVETKEVLHTKDEVVETKEVLDTKDEVMETKEVLDTKDEVVETKKVIMETKEEEEEPVETEEVKEEEETKYIKKISIQPVDPDAENISEDEFPSVQVAKVPETEEVSDEELPGPKRAELPADTEVVSEDELPTVKKEGTKRKLAEGDYDPGSPTSENETSAKKPFLELEADNEKDKVEKPKKLPELDKYWKAVNDDPTDFTGWTYLLQYVDQENDMEAAREAYDAFLSHYPYCYGYWRKYADYEKRKGNKKKCEEVFERGLKAIPLSVDLWIHYLTYVRTTKPEDEEFIRSQFERALGACGLEFRSDRLWDSYIKWETDGKRPQSATAIYDRLLSTPTQGYTTHFDNFQEHVGNHPPNKILEVDEFLALRKEVKHMLKHDVTTDSTDKADAPPGEDTEEVSTDEETKAIRERIISIRRKIHKNTVTNVTGRWNFEEGIKRPYFHVKPLERCQLKNWQEYLDYEIEHGEKSRIIVLFERCLIACALYEEFWLRFVHYLDGLKDSELHGKIKDVYERACTIHHIKKPNLHLQWAMFEESIKNYNKAAEILANIEKSVPNLLQVANRRINLERRREDHEKCSQLYEHYILNSKNKTISTNLSMKYARFCHRILKNVDKSIEVLNVALSKDTINHRIYLQLIDMTMQKEAVCQKEIIHIIDSFLEKESTEIEQKILFAQRKLEFLEDFGSDIQCVQGAYDEYQKYIKLNKETKKKEVKSEPTGKKEKNPPLPSSQASTYGNYGNYGNSSSTGPYPYSGSQQGQYNYSQYGQSDQYQYGNWQYPQGGYSGYNQWSGYSGGYGY